ncbi:MAG: trehalase family glycosidase, partial [Muribaculaceae bacterium]
KPSNNWKRIAKERRKKINSLCIDPSTGLYYDYDYVNQCRSHIYSAGVFNLLYAGIADKRHAKALVEQIGRLKYSCGVVTCEKGERKVTYQWDYPNGWSAPTFMAISGLDRYGYTDEATKIALGYVDSWTKIYNATGNLWEKYNATTGGLDVQDEYAMPGAFMGWTAGVFEFALNYLNSHKQ